MSPRGGLRRGQSMISHVFPGLALSMRILVTDTAPQDTYVAISYNNRWYWISNTDIKSKLTFVVMLLFSIAETGTKGTAPVVTIPANQ